MFRCYTYILASSRNGTIYTGVTNDLRRRVDEHKLHIHKGFTARHGVTKLVWYQEYRYILEAIAMEKRIKHWKRKWKLQLIDSFNPEWKDLAEID